jgi:hypothetical protein
MIWRQCVVGVLILAAMIAVCVTAVGYFNANIQPDYVPMALDYNGK